MQNHVDSRTGRAAAVVLGGLTFLAVVAVLIPLGSDVPFFTGGSLTRRYECGPALTESVRAVPAIPNHGTFAENIAARSAAESPSACRSRARGRLALVLLLGLVVGAGIGAWLWINSDGRAVNRHSLPPPPDSN